MTASLGPWPFVAALLLAALSVVFAALLIHQRRRTRYLLRNRLTPLTVLSDEPAPVERWLLWLLIGAVVVVTLSVLALTGGRFSGR
jgi:hypothetical protein